MSHFRFITLNHQRRQWFHGGYRIRMLSSTVIYFMQFYVYGLVYIFKTSLNNCPILYTTNSYCIFIWCNKSADDDRRALSERLFESETQGEKRLLVKYKKWDWLLYSITFSVKIFNYNIFRFDQSIFVIKFVFNMLLNKEFNFTPDRTAL